MLKTKQQIAEEYAQRCVEDIDDLNKPVAAVELEA